MLTAWVTQVPPVYAPPLIMQGDVENEALLLPNEHTTPLHRGLPVSPQPPPHGLFCHQVARPRHRHLHSAQKSSPTANQTAAAPATTQGGAWLTCMASWASRSRLACRNSWPALPGDLRKSSPPFSPLITGRLLLSLASAGLLMSIGKRAYTVVVRRRTYTQAGLRFPSSQGHNHQEELTEKRVRDTSLPPGQ